MAHIFPSEIGVMLSDGTPLPEVETLRQLRDELPETFYVYHGIHWTKESTGYCLFGEIDFVVVSPIGHVLVIEQKNGIIEDNGTELIKKYGGKSKNVVEQLLRSVDVMRAKHKLRTPRSPPLHIDYLLYLPDHNVKSLNAIGLDQSRVVDARSAAELASRIQSILVGKATGTSADRNQVIAFLTQSLCIVPDVSSYVAAQDRAFVALSNSLADVVRKLDFTPFRLRVLGAAGAGKSQLALDFCARMVEAGKRPLFVCFNRPLADRIRPLLPKGASSDTYHGLIDKFVTAHGLRPDFTKDAQSPEFWQALQDQVVAAEISDSALHGALVIDEGQDFQREWFEILNLLIEPGAPILWLEDPAQNIYRKPSIALDNFVVYRDARNFRTPRSIVRFIEHTLGNDIENCNPVEGLGVLVFGYEKQSDQAAQVAHRIAELIRLGFRHEEIVVISCVGRDKSTFANTEKLGSFGLKRFKGTYTADGRQEYTEGAVLWETLYRFKGQQAPAVILVDVEADTDEDRAKRLLYCGMTRATVRLELMVSVNHPLYPALQRE